MFYCLVRIWQKWLGVEQPNKSQPKPGPQADGTPYRWKVAEKTRTFFKPVGKCHIAELWQMHVIEETIQGSVTKESLFQNVPTFVVETYLHFYNKRGYVLKRTFFCNRPLHCIGSLSSGKIWRHSVSLRLFGFQRDENCIFPGWNTPLHRRDFNS